jgi:serine/threonine protein kinase/Tfp pilus assembly protein PilF
LAVGFPGPGAILARFRLLSILGRGAFAQVYLAEQLDLADRPVALKVSAVAGEEPQNLARLQHTHIVPIYSVHDDPQTNLRLICMPYVGGANLAEILRTADGSGVAISRSISQATGRSLVAALDRLGRPPVECSGRGPDAPSARSAGLAADRSPGRTVTGGMDSPSRARSVLGRYLARLPWWMEPGPGAVDCSPGQEPAPARRYLQSATLVQAAAWIAARLAEGLEHAHERGVLHRDLKPSNILIAGDGTPMLLDFNLSARTDDDSGARARLGGTLPYMAPEQLDAFNPEGRTPPEAVGPGADIYSLGLILYEMCTGVHPFSDPPSLPRLADMLRIMIDERREGAPSVRLYNPLIPWGFASILGKCLDPEPARRYARAGDLAEDLRRQLDDLPLKFAPEPNLRERLRKWGRRHPRASSSVTIGVVATMLMASIAAAGWSLRERYERSAARLKRQEFSRDFRDCQVLLNTAGPTSHLGLGVDAADRLLASYGVARGGRWLLAAAVRRLPAGERTALVRDIVELIQMRAWASVNRADRRHGSEARRRAAIEEAIAWLDEAERLDPRPPSALYRVRSELHRAHGDGDEARCDQRLAAVRRPQAARDFELEGKLDVGEGRLDAGEASLNQAVNLDPQRFWSWFLLGLCHREQHRYLEAAADFAICTVLSPDFAWSHQNRGLALAAAGRLPEARIALDRALELSPDFAEARVNRALVCLELGEAGQAADDLARAIRLGRREVATRAAYAEALTRIGRRAEAESQFGALLAENPDDVPTLDALGFSLLATDPARARAEFEHALSLSPDDSRALLGLAHIVRHNDPRQGLRLLDHALIVEPDFGDALQLQALVHARLGDPATVADVDRLERTPTPHRLYQAACAMAILHGKTHAATHADRAIELLGRALGLGFKARDPAQDPDLASVRDRPEFRALCR